MKTLDLNCDMGELQPGATRNFDAEIMPYITSCNIACGFHSGNPLLMEQTIRLAMEHGVKIGAHPAYDDRENFGRVSLEVERPVLLAQLRYQIGAVKSMVESLGGRLHHVKAHGALYNDMNADGLLAEDFVQLVKGIDPGLVIVALAGSVVIEACHRYGVACWNEGFADRRYDRVDRLRSRVHEDAVLHEPAEVLGQVDDFLAGQVRLVDGRVGEVRVDTVCLHSDTEGAVELSRVISEHLAKIEDFRKEFPSFPRRGARRVGWLHRHSNTRVSNPAVPTSAITHAEFTTPPVLRTATPPRRGGEFLKISLFSDASPDFLLLTSPDPAALRRLGTAIYHQRFAFIDEVIVTEVEICLKLNAAFTPECIAQLETLAPGPTATATTYRLPIFFEPHSDWEQICAHTGLTRNRFIEQLLAQPYTLAMFGFLPGFAYLDGLPENLQVPRKSVPAKYVAANSVAIGGKYLGIYSLPSPGGWHVLGRTPISLLEPGQLPPVALNPGDQLLLHPLSEAEFVALQQHPITLRQYNAQS